MRSLLGIINESISDTKRVLFQEFLFQKWVVWGLCSWLVAIGQFTGGLGFDFRNILDHSINKDAEASREFWDAADYLLNSPEGNFFTRLANLLETEVEVLFGVITAVLLMIFVVLAIKIALNYISSRFQFILLDNIMQNKMEIGIPWRRWKIAGGNYFLHALCRWILLWGIQIIFWLFGGVAFWQYFKNCVASGEWLMPEPIDFIAFIGIGTGYLIYSFAMGFYVQMWQNYVLPAMYYQNITFPLALQEMWSCVKKHIWYTLGFCIVIPLLGFLAIMFLMMVTCCMISCLLFIPVIGGIVLLPVTVFTQLCRVKFYWALREG